MFLTIMLLGSVLVGWLTGLMVRRHEILGLLAVSFFGIAVTIHELNARITRLDSLWVFGGFMIGFWVAWITGSAASRAIGPIMALLPALLCLLFFREPFAGPAEWTPSTSIDYLAELYSSSRLFGATTALLNQAILFSAALVIAGHRRAKWIAIVCLLFATMVAVVGLAEFGTEEAATVPHGSVLVWFAGMLDNSTLLLLLLGHATIPVVGALWWFDLWSGRSDSRSRAKT